MKKLELLKEKKRLQALALSLAISATLSSCDNINKNNDKKNADTYILDENEIIAEKMGNLEESKFVFIWCSEDYYYGRYKSREGYPRENWHAVHIDEYEESDYDYIVKSHVISSVKTKYNEDGTITYIVPKGYELRTYDRQMFAIPESADVVYNYDDEIIIGTLEDGCKTYTIPAGYIIEDADKEKEIEYVNYELKERSDVKKVLK